MTSATLVIPTRGGAQRLPLLFKALEQQTHDDWNAIVVIDGDIDGSERVVHEYDHLPIRAIVLPENRGRVTALNTGFGAAQGDIVIRCDDDFEPAPEHIAAHVAAHESKVCGVVGLPINLAPDNVYMRVYGYDADARSRREAEAMDAADRWRIWGGNTSIPRAVFEQLGGFCDAYRGYGWEDLDFGYRVHLAGIPIELAPEAAVRHHMASVNTTERAKRAYASGTARQTFDQLHGTGASGGQGKPLASAWSAAVASTSLVIAPATLPTLARIAERAARLLPAAVGRKCIALTVEAATLAGYRHGGAAA